MKEISESNSSEQVEETWTPNTSAPPSSLSQVNPIGCADEGLWIFSLEDSKKRRYSVNWDETNLTEKWKTEEHESMIDSGCLGHVCPPWFAPQFPMVSSTNVDVVAANNVALQHYGQKVVYGHVMTNSGKRILIQITFDVMNVRKTVLSTSALKHRGVTSSSITILTASFFETRVSRLSFLFARHFDEWNSSLQSFGDGWREYDR